MYMTFFAGSPCAKTVSFPRYLPTFLPRPVESRNNLTSNAGPPKLTFLRERRRLTGLRRTTKDMLNQNSMDSAGCSKPVQYLVLNIGQSMPRVFRFQLVLKIA